jgi:amidophosphoribosyltransferase
VYVTGDITSDDLTRLGATRGGSEEEQDDASRLALPNPIE